MNTKKLFKQKIETEVDRAQAKLAHFRVRGMGFTAEAKDRHDAYVAELELKLDATKARLRDLVDAEEHQWEKLKDSVENTLNLLEAALKDAAENFKDEPPIAGLHGADEGHYPYVRGLTEKRIRQPKRSGKQDHNQ
ncbi:hypothetical protein [Desulfosediminicola flagellatus]|uniref:hypothetical protein n=1 Tax=Desulfosediminicola flagellatus TaxID=2569541 RepID=UPI0010ABD72A|nr:hypothetical protein [Desulfosediminicola flagellatus]